MEKDPKIAALIREAGIEKAPEGFTATVMDRIADMPAKKVPYRPPIGRRGWWIIGILTLALLLVIFFSYEPGTGTPLPERLGMEGTWQMPELRLDFSRLTGYGPIAAGFLAIFILVVAATRPGRHSVA